jgi:hypothetical protein
LSTRARSRLARSVHDGGVLRGVVPALMLTAGCIIPPSLSVDTADAGANAAPAIISVRADDVELPEFQRVIFERGLGTLNLTVHDTDLGDKLFCKVFVEYRPDDPTPPRANNETAGSTVARTCTLPLAGLCQSADIGVERLMQVVVFDRQIIEGVSPLYQAMVADGLKASRTLFVTCVEPSQ